MNFPKLRGVIAYNGKYNIFIQNGGRVGPSIHIWNDLESMNRTLNAMITGEVRYSYKTGQYTVDKFHITGPSISYTLEDMAEWGVFDIETQEFKGTVREMLVVLINKRLDTLTKKLLKKEPDADVRIEYVK